MSDRNRPESQTGIWVTAIATAAAFSLSWAAGATQVAALLLLAAAVLFEIATLRALFRTARARRYGYLSIKTVEYVHTPRRRRVARLAAAAIPIAVTAILLKSPFRDDFDWERIARPGHEGGYGDYLEKWPAGRHVLEARSRYERSMWRSALSRDEYDEYIESFPHGVHLAEAVIRQEEVVWRWVGESGDFNAYMQRYPHGKHVADVDSAAEVFRSQHLVTVADHDAFIRAYPRSRYLPSVIRSRDLLVRQAREDAAYRRPVVVFVLDHGFSSLAEHGARVVWALQLQFAGSIERVDVGNDRSKGPELVNIVAALAEIAMYADQHPDVGIVVNMSWGSSTGEESLRLLLSQLHTRGVFLVAAAGNDHADICPFPAAYDESVMAVGSAWGGEIYSQRAPYSNQGSCVDILATDASGTKLIDLVNRLAEPAYAAGMRSRISEELEEATRDMGTSFTAPIVAGTLARMMAINRNLSRSDIEAMLYHTASRTNEGDPVVDPSEAVNAAWSARSARPLHP